MAPINEHILRKFLMTHQRSRNAEIEHDLLGRQAEHKRRSASRHAKLALTLAGALLAMLAAVWALPLM